VAERVEPSRDWSRVIAKGAILIVLAIGTAGLAAASASNEPSSKRDEPSSRGSIAERAEAPRSVVEPTSESAESRSTSREGLIAKQAGSATVVSGTRRDTTIERRAAASDRSFAPRRKSIVAGLWENVRHNLFKPLLLFFYLGFFIPILRVKFEFPYAIYQGLTIFLLIAIGWHGGEELSKLTYAELSSAVGFMLLGFFLNFLIGILAYVFLSAFTRLRRVDKATVAGYYGSDSAGTFVTCLGVLAGTNLAFDAYMPVMLAIMEIPGCLVALYLVSRLRRLKMDPLGNMPDEPGYNPGAAAIVPIDIDPHGSVRDRAEVVEEEKLSLELTEGESDSEERSIDRSATRADLRGTLKLLHEVFLNPGLVLLFGGIVIGFISGLQGPAVVKDDDSFFVTLFPGVLCLFLLEMGMTASRKLKDLRSAGWRYVVFGLAAPNVFAVIAIVAAHGYALLTHTTFKPGTYVLFSVLCAAASYIAVPAVQRLAIPEASPTLPLAASLGLTFSYNVTIGIPVYIEIARLITGSFPQ
jgi:hypothetical protein